MYYALQSLSNAAALLLISGVVLYTKYWILCACVLCIYSNIGYYMHIICTVVMHGTKDDFWHLEGMPPWPPFKSAYANCDAKQKCWRWHGTDVETTKTKCAWTAKTINQD